MALRVHPLGSDLGLRLDTERSYPNWMRAGMQSLQPGINLAYGGAQSRSRAGDPTGRIPQQITIDDPVDAA